MHYCSKIILIHTNKLVCFQNAILNFIYVYEGLPAGMCTSHVCLGESEEDIGSPGAGIMNGCKPPAECWEPNPGPLQE